MKKNNNVIVSSHNNFFNPSCQRRSKEVTKINSWVISSVVGNLSSARKQVWCVCVLFVLNERFQALAPKSWRISCVIVICEIQIESSKQKHSKMQKLKTEKHKFIISNLIIVIKYKKIRHIYLVVGCDRVRVPWSRLT